MLPMTWPLLRMIWTIDKYAMPHLRLLVYAARDQAKIFHVRTLRDLHAFYREVDLYTQTN